MLEAPELGAPVGLFGAPMGPQKVFAPPAENRTDAYDELDRMQHKSFNFLDSEKNEINILREPEIS